LRFFAALIVASFTGFGAKTCRQAEKASAVSENQEAVNPEGSF